MSDHEKVNCRLRVNTSALRERLRMLGPEPDAETADAAWSKWYDACHHATSGQFEITSRLAADGVFEITATWDAD